MNHNGDYGAGGNSATQITGDAAYYRTNVGGWRVHNVAVHALL